MRFGGCFQKKCGSVRFKECLSASDLSIRKTRTYLVGLKTLDSLLLLLLAEDDERATVLVECKTHVD